MRSIGLILSIPAWLWLGSATMAVDPVVVGDGQISATAGPSRIVIRTTDRLAGAIDSLRWNGKEFLDSFDHGRQLQSASSFDVGSSFTPETFNPTEAGSRADGTGTTSSSHLLQFDAAHNRLTTRTRMAFWLKPNEKSFGHPAKNRSVVSDHILSKRVTIGYRNLPHVIEYITTFTVPNGEGHTYAQFEAITGYMPREFSRFLVYRADRHELQPLDAGPGEQPHPVIFATASGSHAMGVYSPDLPSAGYPDAGYGRFRFDREKVVKWNCVFRVRNKALGIEPGPHTFRSYVGVGSLDDVIGSLRQLHRWHATDRPEPPASSPNGSGH